MKTTHQVYFKNSENMSDIPEKSVDLVVTSPPYPMIQMWDKLFWKLNSKIEQAMDQGKGFNAFELMHKELDKVWDGVCRVLKPGGFACINIGDAVRTINGNFALYPNHSRILTYLVKAGLTPLPAILWRKQTNAPNKFMGSGMLPAGAYVTLEHEFILVLRKGFKREFLTPSRKKHRQESAFFWEERNNWFSDVWMDLKGARQMLPDETVRKRSAAFPFELPFRLINMYSAKEDTVLDPFLGIGTTMAAAISVGRNSIGYELSADFNDPIFSRSDTIVDFANERIRERIENHLLFVQERTKTKGKFKYENIHYRFPVITNQERKLYLNPLVSVKSTKKNILEAVYSNTPQESESEDRKPAGKKSAPPETAMPEKISKKRKKPVQTELFN
jgi:DNA modification methylase